MIFNHCVTELAIQNALRFSNQFYSLKNTQNCIFGVCEVFENNFNVIYMSRITPQYKIVGNIK